MDGYLLDSLKKLAMLHHVNKCIWLIILLLCVFSCGDEQKELQEKRKMFYEMSKSTVSGIDEYYRVYSFAHDSINSWIENNLDFYTDLKLNTWEIDSLVCFNKNGDKCIMTILKRATFFKKAVQDDIRYFNGVKIKNDWYFFSGGTLVLPRQYYQRNIHKPLSFDKMKDLAIKHIYRGYLKKGADGTWEINDDFFSDLTSGAWCTHCTTQAQWDSVYLRQVQLNWEKRDYKKYNSNE